MECYHWKRICACACALFFVVPLSLSPSNGLSRLPQFSEISEVGNRTDQYDGQSTTSTTTAGYTNWPGAQLLTENAKPFFKTQNPEDCATAQFIKYDIGNKGLGSDLHRWAWYLCLAHMRGAVLWTPAYNWYDPKSAKKQNKYIEPLPNRSATGVGLPWIFLDQDFCPTWNATPRKTAFECYVRRETRCEEPRAFSALFTELKNETKCMGSEKHAAGKYNAGAMVFLFSHLQERLLHRIKHEAAVLFGPSGAPASMISVSIRWGDKFKEMRLAPVSVYIKHVKHISSKCKLPAKLTVFLMSEDPNAVKAFKDAAPSQWVLRWYAPAIDTTIGKENVWKNPMYHAAATRGANGLHSLIALFLSLQSRHFVFSGRSNWGILLGELATERMSTEQACEPIIDICKRGFHCTRRAGTGFH